MNGVTVGYRETEFTFQVLASPVSCTHKSLVITTHSSKSLFLLALEDLEFYH